MYCTLEDLKKRLPEDSILQLADDTGAGTLEDDAVMAVINEAIEAADAEIDAYVGRVRETPLAPVPALIANMAADMAVQALYMRPHGLAIPEKWTAAMERHLKALRLIADKKLALGAAEGETAAPATNTARTAADQGRLAALKELF